MDKQAVNLKINEMITKEVEAVYPEMARNFNRFVDVVSELRIMVEDMFPANDEDVLMFLACMGEADEHFGNAFFSYIHRNNKELSKKLSKIVGSAEFDDFEDDSASVVISSGSVVLN